MKIIFGSFAPELDSRVGIHAIRLLKLDQEQENAPLGGNIQRRLHLYYRLMTHGQAWVDRGTAEFERCRQERQFATLQREARDFGMKLVPAA